MKGDARAGVGWKRLTANELDVRAVLKGLRDCSAVWMLRAIHGDPQQRHRELPAPLKPPCLALQVTAGRPMSSNPAPAAIVSAVHATDNHI